MKNAAAGMWARVIGAGVIAVLVVSCVQKANREALEKRAQDATACRESLPCWGEKAAQSAGARCRAHIEAMARYEVKWASRYAQDDYKTARWIEKGDGTVSLIGDGVTFQNGFGAHGPVVYECDIDPVADRVLAARIVREGRLPAR